MLCAVSDAQCKTREEITSNVTKKNEYLILTNWRIQFIVPVECLLFFNFKKKNNQNL